MKVVSRPALRHSEAARRLREAEDYPGARRELRKALSIIARGPMPWSSPITKLRWMIADADLRAGLGEIGIHEGRPDLARRDLEDALARYVRISHAHSADVAIICNNLGVVYERLGMTAESQAYLLRATDIARRTGRDLATELVNLALMYQHSGYNAEAVAKLAEALRLPGLTDEIRDRIRQEQAFVMLSSGDYAGSLVELAGLLGDVEPGSIAAASLLGNMAQAYAEMQRLDEAEERQRAAVEIREQRQPGSLPLAVAKSNLAATIDARDPAGAEKLLREAIALAERIAPSGPELAVMRGRLAGVLLDRDRPGPAAALARAAINGAPGANRFLTSAYLAEAIAYDRVGDRGHAVRALTEAERICRAVSPLLPELRVVLTALGTLRWDADELDEAARCFDEAIRIAESQRAGSAAEPGLELLFGTARDAYHGRIAVAAQRGAGDAAAAFRSAEAFRARTLGELLVAAGSARELGPQAQRVSRELAAAREALRAGSDDRRGLAAEEERLRLELRALTPAPPAAERVPPCTVPEIQKVLGGRTALLLYESTDEGTYVWTVTGQHLGFDRVDATPDELAAAVADVLGACRDPDAETPAAALHRLGAWLLPELPAEVDRLVVCAGDELAYLPFEALEAGGAPLAERYVVWAAPSATTLVRFGTRPRRPPVREFAGFAVAVVPGQQPLPAAPREVEDIAALYPDSAVARTGAAATVAAVRADAPGSRYVHFATHGNIDDDRPFLSGMPLAGDGGFLSAYRMAELNLCADLVSCSACRSAVGQIRTGEGVVGFGHALFGAGARAVVLARWPVQDRIAKRLMVRLHQELRAGRTAADALRAAAAATRSVHPHPREWAGFMLLSTGDQ